jgi:hypothetical protein
LDSYRFIVFQEIESKLEILKLNVLEENMKLLNRVVLISFILSLFYLSFSVAQDVLKDEAGVPLNMLSLAEKNAGWKLLWDGKTTAGWRGARLDKFPEFGWEIKNGELSVLESGGAESRNGGDIVTENLYGNFELSLEFKLTPGANSGIKYFVFPKQPDQPGSAIGLEYQVLDDERHPDAKAGVEGNRTVSSLYDLIPAANKVVNPIGEWNSARIVVNGSQVQHWLNGVKVVEYNRHCQTFLALIQKSKYAKYKNFGQIKEGHILIQDHGNLVSYRNIKIREL